MAHCFAFLYSTFYFLILCCYIFLDKLRKGKRESSPDKPGTPSGDILEEGAPPPEKPVIVNDEILALQITKDNLEKVTDVGPTD